MTNSSSRVVRSLAAAGFGLVLLTGCNSGSDELGQDQLQDKIKQTMNTEHATASPVKDVACPSGLKAEVGATVTCTATTESGEKVDVEVKAESVTDDQIHYSMKPKQRTDGVQG